MSQTELKKILYVEDEPDISQIAKLALETVGGFEVEIAVNGKEALQRVRQCRPDLILLDVMMPEMDGPTTLKQLQSMEEAADIPVVFMTAKVQVDEVSSYQALGAADVIAKPFDPMALSDRVRQIWQAWHRA